MLFTEPAALLPLLDHLRHWVEIKVQSPSRSQRKKDSNTLGNSEIRDDAINATYVALTETQIYLGRWDRRLSSFTRLASTRGRISQTGNANNNLRDEDTEAQLARLWTAAANKLRKFDPDLADRCFTKSDFWASPEKWDEQSVHQASIRIEDVLNSIRKLSRQEID